MFEGHWHGSDACKPVYIYVLFVGLRVTGAAAMLVNPSVLVYIVYVCSVSVLYMSGV